MKAQSELTGDRERRAEMTRPRCGGVTNWITGINNAMSVTAMEEMEQVMREVNHVADEMTSVNRMAQQMAGASVISCTLNPEVKNCPPIRQRVGCTP